MVITNTQYCLQGFKKSTSVFLKCLGGKCHCFGHETAKLLIKSSAVFRATGINLKVPLKY